MTIIRKGVQVSQGGLSKLKQITRSLPGFFSEEIEHLLKTYYLIQIIYV